MQILTEMIGENKVLLWLLGAAALLLAALIAVLLYRLLFGQRLRGKAGRARQPRLGVVDAYDLDRNRQLVIVRRDNVEHLVMIGGPNDLLIEQTIVRAVPVGAAQEARTVREAAAIAAAGGAGPALLDQMEDEAEDEPGDKGKAPAPAAPIAAKPAQQPA
ncbi:MAG: hypothetical protein ACO27F_12110, partial [Beijerinckiaceae bacterium]